MPEFEQIGNYRFCRYRRPNGPTSAILSWSFPLVLVLTVGGFLAASKWAISETERGNFIPMKVVAFALLGTVGAIYPLAIGLIVAKRFKKRSEPLLKKVGPEHAIPCSVHLSHAGKHFALAEGWLWLDEDLLTFRGDRFDFALRPRDFHKSFKSERMAQGQPVRLLSLKGHGWIGLRIEPLATGLTARQAIKESDRVMRTLTEDWRRAASTTRASLFPPLTRESMPETSGFKGRKFAFACLVSSLAFALLGLAIHWMFRDYMEQSNPLLFASAFGLLPVTFLLSIWGAVLTSRSERKAIQKLKDSGWVEMV